MNKQIKNVKFITVTKGINNMTYTYDTDLFSDLYKEVNGMRPSLNNEFYQGTPALKQEIWDYYLERAQEQFVAEKKATANAVKSWKDEVFLMYTKGAEDFATAVKWIVDASGETFYNYQCVDMFLWGERLEGTEYGEHLKKTLYGVVNYEDA